VNITGPKIENMPWWGKNIYGEGANICLRGKNILNIRLKRRQNTAEHSINETFRFITQTKYNKVTILNIIK